VAQKIDGAPRDYLALEAAATLAFASGALGSVPNSP